MNCSISFLNFWAEPHSSTILPFLAIGTLTNTVGDDGDEGLAPALLKVHAHDDGEQQIAEDVVAVGALELRGDECPEAAGAARRFGRGQAAVRWCERIQLWS